MPRSTKGALIDAIVSKVTHFTGDKRDGDIPPITVQNFHELIVPRSARAYRARLSQMSCAELLGELSAADAFVAGLDAYKEEKLAQLARDDSEAEDQAFRQDQADHGRRPRRQRELIEAAAHHRPSRTMSGRKMTPLIAWGRIKEHPYVATNGATVMIEGEGKTERMLVRSPNGTQRREGILRVTWTKNYWRAAAAKPTLLEPG
jgi:hypothetical protein